MMKQFLKVTFVFGLCLRLVLFTSLVSAGDRYADLQKAALASSTQTQEDIEKLIDELEAIDPDEDKMTCCEAIDYYEKAREWCSETNVRGVPVCKKTTYFEAYKAVRDACRFVPGSWSYDIEASTCELRSARDELRSLERGGRESDKQGYDYTLGGSGADPFTESKDDPYINSGIWDEDFSTYVITGSRKPNPFTKINDAELERDYTPEECCEALEDYNNLVAACSRSERNIGRIGRINLCGIIHNGQTILDEASEDVKEKCNGNSPEVLNRHRGTKHVCEG